MEDFDDFYAANYADLVVQIYAYFGDRQEAQVFLVLTVLIFIMHHANITRLIRGREGKIGESAKSVE